MNARYGSEFGNIHYPCNCGGVAYEEWDLSGNFKAKCNKCSNPRPIKKEDILERVSES